MDIKIGIDIDNTMVYCDSPFYSLLNSVNLNKGKKAKHYEIVDNGVYKSTIFNKLFRFLNPKKYFVFPYVKETINKLTEKGFQIIVVSRRPILKSLVALTLGTYKRNNLSFKKLIMGCNNKRVFAEEEGLDYFIDNQENICLDLLENSKTKPIHFNSQIKKTEEVKYANLLNFSSWQAIQDFFLLQNFDEGLSNKETFVG